LVRGLLRVYEHPLSPYAQKVKIALAEKGVPFEAVLPAAIGSGAVAGEFAAANPRGEVPVLVDGDVTLFDSSVIVAYVEERWPEPPLLPATPAERARVRTLEEVMDTHYEAINWGLAEVLAFGRAQGELAARLVARAAQQTAALQAWLEAHLAGRRWLNGAEFGMGDLCVAPFVNGSVGFGNRPRPGTRLADWLARVNERPSVAAAAQAAARAAAEAATSLGTVAQQIASGQFKREYRDHRLEWMIRSGGLDVVLEGLAKGNIRFVEFPSA
jgi:glutathione S-transferase/RNA polymerase-associated protein